MSRTVILETDRLVLRNVESEDAPFILDLLNQPSFKKFIGDRGVRDLDQARDYIETRFTRSYKDNEYGLYLMELKPSLVPIGLCGFVRRADLPAPDIGFALLPQFEKQGFGFEAAEASMHYGRETLGLSTILAITTLDNERSGRLLEKIGLRFERNYQSGDETLKLFSTDN